MSKKKIHIHLNILCNHDENKSKTDAREIHAVSGTDEWVRSIIYILHSKWPKRKKAVKLFKILDKNDMGEVGLSELIRFVKVRNFILNNFSIKISLMQVWHNVNNHNEAYNDAVSCMRDYDKDLNGTLNMIEFYEMIFGPLE